MRLIVAVNNLGVIGKGSDIPWRCRADLKHFKATTMGGTLIVGSTTRATLPKEGLPGRDILTVGTEYSSLWNVVQKAYFRRTPENIWVAGGESIYKQLLPLCSEIHISFINDDTPGDKFFAVPVDYKGLVVPYYFEPDSERRD